jgi:hypothetical protein
MGAMLLLQDEQGALQAEGVARELSRQTRPRKLFWVKEQFV